METLTIDMARLSGSVIYLALSAFLFYVAYWLLCKKRELEDQRVWEERRNAAVSESKKRVGELVRRALADLEKSPESREAISLLGEMCITLGNDPLGKGIFELLKCWRRTPQVLGDKIMIVYGDVSKWEKEGV